ncbi:cupin domain-containing protein [Luteimonas sp. MJ246]|uniref:cupin domain-containing protein n=1 Tax=Luteimonas sp. MJ174 TaxID=3129237 RepID=UPI0031B9C752
MPPADFLRGYWQKRPLLIRNAIPGYVSPIAPEDLAGLACEDGVLARIIEHDRAADAWTVRQGPFPEDVFPAMPRQDWTLLVQDVDKWDSDIAGLLQHFGFLPRWRLDDVMVSFAAPGGSVGAHVDQYDVFLLQALGHRRWMIDASVAMGGAEPPLAFRDDVDIKLLREFTASHDWVLGPGDMLYLPPNVPHHGVAEDACLTFSVGMRAPSAAELLGDFADSLLADADDDLRYADPDLTLPGDPAEIDAAAMLRVARALELLRSDDPQRLGDWFGGFITRYRNAGEVAPGDGEEPPRSRIEVEWDLEHGAELHRHPYSRMAWRRADVDARLYVNGEAHPLPAEDAITIANAAVIGGDAYTTLSAGARGCVLALLEAGHYQLVLEGHGDGDDGDDGDDDGT